MMQEELTVSQNEGDNKPQRGSGKGFFVLVIVISIIVSSVSGAAFGFLSGGASGFLSSVFPGKFLPAVVSKDVAQINSDASKQTIIEEESAVTSVVEKSTPAVVSIVISKNVPRFRSFGPFEFFFGNPAPSQRGQGGATQRQEVGSGSGFLIDSNGLILTNNHVVEDTNADYTVITQDRKEYEAKVLARDPIRDLAMIKIEGSGFPFLALGDSTNLKIGQTVVAIGNSLGEFSNTVSKGIISGLRRNLTAGSALGDTERLSDVIQTDAAINPGNSGGPLLNINGDVIGINVAKAQAENIGFAVPVNQARRVIDQAKTGKVATLPFLGVMTMPINADLQGRYNLSFDYGALVARGQDPTDLAVIPGSPADKAGIVENDVILEINGEKITETNLLSDVIFKYNPGDVLTIKLYHKGDIKEMKVTLGERKQ